MKTNFPVRERLPRLYDSDDDAWFDDETDRSETDDEPTLRRDQGTDVRSFFAELADELEAAFGRSA
jgi:hypothetical protein